MKLTQEEEVYLAVSRYLQFTYPMLPFRFDYGAGATLYFRQASFQKMIQKGRAWPDLFIAAPQFDTGAGAVIGVGKWGGMFLEVKPSGYKLYKKDGVTLVNEHIEEQANAIEHLKAAGYWAEFGLGTDDCIRKIDEYLKFTKYHKRGTWKR